MRSRVSTPGRPDRRFDLSRPTDRSAAVAVAIAALLALVIWSPGFGGADPGSPSAVAGDARLQRCGGTLDQIQFAFPIPHARDYQRYIPAMPRASELEIDPPALVVVYRSGLPGVPPPSGAAGAGDRRDLCVYVGVAGQGELNYFRSVPVAGLRATPAGPVLVPAPQT
jgi:hypothetical protein